REAADFDAQTDPTPPATMSAAAGDATTAASPGRDSAPPSPSRESPIEIQPRIEFASMPLQDDDLVSVARDETETPKSATARDLEAIMRESIAAQSFPPGAQPPGVDAQPNTGTAGVSPAALGNDPTITGT